MGQFIDLLYDLTSNFRNNFYSTHSLVAEKPIIIFIILFPITVVCCLMGYVIYSDNGSVKASKGIGRKGHWLYKTVAVKGKGCKGHWL